MRYPNVRFFGCRFGDVSTAADSSSNLEFLFQSLSVMSGILNFSNMQKERKRVSPEDSSPLQVKKFDREYQKD